MARGVAASDQEFTPSFDGGDGEQDGAGGEDYTNYDKTAWRTRVKSGEEVFWFGMNNNIPLTTSFLTEVAEELGLDELGLGIITKYISRSNRQNIATLLVKSRKLERAVKEVLTGIGNKFDAKQLVLGFGETFDVNLKRNKKRVLLKNVFEKDGMQPQFKKRRVWQGNTQQEVTPKQQHAKIQKIFCTAVAKRMALKDYEDQQQRAGSGAYGNFIQNKIIEIRTQYAYLLSRIRNASWVQLSPELGFLTETPSLYDGAKSAAVGQLSYKKKVDENKLQFTNRYKRILNDYKKKRQRNSITDPLTDPVRPHGVLPTTRRAIKEKLQRTGSTGRIALNYQ